MSRYFAASPPFSYVMMLRTMFLRRLVSAAMRLIVSSDNPVGARSSSGRSGILPNAQCGAGRSVRAIQDRAASFLPLCCDPQFYSVLSRTFTPRLQPIPPTTWAKQEWQQRGSNRVQNRAEHKRTRPLW